MRLFTKNPGDPNFLDSPEAASAWAQGNLNSKKGTFGPFSWIKDTTRSALRTTLNLATLPLQIAYGVGTVATGAPRTVTRLGIGVTDSIARANHTLLGKPLGLLQSFFNKIDSAVFGDRTQVGST